MALVTASLAASTMSSRWSVGQHQASSHSRIRWRATDAVMGSAGRASRSGRRAWAKEPEWNN